MVRLELLVDGKPEHLLIDLDGRKPLVDRDIHVHLGETIYFDRGARHYNDEMGYPFHTCLLFLRQ